MCFPLIHFTKLLLWREWSEWSKKSSLGFVSFTFPTTNYSTYGYDRYIPLLYIYSLEHMVGRESGRDSCNFFFHRMFIDKQDTSPSPTLRSSGETITHYLFKVRHVRNFSSSRICRIYLRITISLAHLHTYALYMYNNTLQTYMDIYT